MLKYITDLTPVLFFPETELVFWNWVYKLSLFMQLIKGLLLKWLYTKCPDNSCFLIISVCVCLRSSEASLFQLGNKHVSTFSIKKPPNKQQFSRQYLLYKTVYRDLYFKQQGSWSIFHPWPTPANHIKSLLSGTLNRIHSFFSKDFCSVLYHNRWQTKT